MSRPTIYRIGARRATIYAVRPAHVAILVHPGDAFDATSYFLRAIADVWREDGVRVTVLRDAGLHVDADLAVLHVDLTVVPPAHLDAARRYPVAVNARVADISKRRVSTSLVRRGDGYDGPVIVKTDRNCGGVREARLRRRSRLRAFVETHSWRYRSVLPTDQYPIFESAARVPGGIWRNPRLVVERFLPERDGDWYCLRTWVFLGDRETNSISWSAHPIIKSSTVVRREPLAAVPDELRLMRHDLGFDFGKFDYALVDGRVVLYDANRTPTLGSFSRDDADQLRPRIRLLAEGIRAWT